MRKKLLSLGAIFGIMLIIPFASGQVFEKATFQESALVIYDQQYSNSVITSIGLETTDNQEIKFTDELIQKINDILIKIHYWCCLKQMVALLVHIVFIIVI